MKGFYTRKEMREKFGVGVWLLVSFTEKNNGCYAFCFYDNKYVEYYINEKAHMVTYHEISEHNFTEQIMYVRDWEDKTNTTKPGDCVCDWISVQQIGCKCGAISPYVCSFG